MSPPSTSTDMDTTKLATESSEHEVSITHIAPYFAAVIHAFSINTIGIYIGITFLHGHTKIKKKTSAGVVLFLNSFFFLISYYFLFSPS